MKKAALILGGGAVAAGAWLLTQSIVSPTPLDPPTGIIIPIPAALRGQLSDFFTATNINGPWTYRTEDLRITTNADGTTSGYFTNTTPVAMQEFYLIVPVGYPLPANIITNS